jgi:hypothetical protein
VLWGGWLLVTAVTFTYMRGIIHPYYTVALAPAIAALVGTGGVLLWQRRREIGRAAYVVLAGVAVVTGAWDVTLLRSQSAFHPWVAILAIAASVLALLGLGAAALRAGSGRRLLAGAALVTIIGLGIPAGAWSVATAATPHNGSIPAAVTTGASVGPAGGGHGFGGTVPQGSSRAGTRASGSAARSATGRGGTGGPGGGSLGGGSPGGASPGGGASVSSALTAALERTTTRWAAATDGSQSAASLELATGGKAVMAIGGFTGSDPAPTLAQFKAYVAAGDITYYIAGGHGGPGGGNGVSSQITSWVQAHFSATTIGGQTVYVLHR